MSLESERFVKSYPAFIGSVIWQDDGLFKLYHYCLYKASHNCFIWNGRILQPGELPISRRQTSKELCWSKDKLNQKLSVLEQAGLITILITRRGTLVRLTQWSVRETGTLCEDNLSSAVPETSMVCADNVHTDDKACAENQHVKMPCVPESNTVSDHSERKTRPNQDKKEECHVYKPTAPEPDGFLTLWLRYPAGRRNHRTEAAILFAKAFQEGATLESMMKALEADMASVDWTKENGQYIPGIMKWLLRERWRDFAQKPKSREDELWKSW